MADVTLNIRHNADQATSSVKSLSNAMGSFVSNANKASKAGLSVAAGFSKIGKAMWNTATGPLKKATSGFSKLTSSLGRIAFYRAIRFAIRYVTDSFKQGLDAAYNWSKQQGGANAKLAAAMDNLSAASGRMKLQLGAAFGGLITAIEPILIRIINLVTAAADAITRFFAILNGSGYYKKAVGSLDDLGSAAGGAGKQVKGLLASWDELTVIGKESGGGGGGSNGTDYSGMYEWAEAESDWATLFQNGDFFGIGEKITEGLGDIAGKFSEWLDNLKEMDIGGKFAAFLNGVFSNSETWSEIGGVIGKGLGVIATAIIRFFEEFDFSQFLESIGAFVSGLAASFFEQLKDVFPEGSFADNMFEGLYDVFNNLEEWFTSGDFSETFSAWCDGLVTAYQRVKVSLQTLFNDIKISWLENKQAILESMNDLPDWAKDVLGWVGFDISEAMDRNSVALGKAKERAEELAEEYKNLYSNGDKATESTDNLNQSLDELPEEKHVTVYVDTEPTREPFTLADIIDIPDITGSGGVSTGGLHGTTISLGILPKAPEKVSIDVTANYTDWSVRGTKDDSTVKSFTTWNSTANYKDRQVRGSTSKSIVDAFTTWDSTANYNHYKVYGSTSDSEEKRFTTWDSTANWNNYQVYGTNTDSAKKRFTTWNSTANFNDRALASSFSTDFNSKARFNTRELGTNFSTTFNSTAHITSKTIADSLKDGNNLKMNVTANITKVNNSSNVNITAAANGGTIETGQLFIANEAGPEMVGTIGNQTAVANNDQIVSGIASGVAQAEQEQNALLRQQNSILSQLLAKELTITPSVGFGQVVARSADLYARA